MLYRALDPRRAIEILRWSTYRWYVVGRIAGTSTGKMRAVVQGWLVYQMTGSALALGWVSAAQALVMLLLAPFGGVISDRFEKRMVMFWARVLLGVANLGLIVIIMMGALQVWHIVIVTMLEGIAFTFLDPAQNSIIAELVDRETLLNAVSVSSLIEGVVSIIGATVAGLLITARGPVGVYIVMVALFCLAGYSVLRLPRGRFAGGPQPSVRLDMLAGVRYLAASPALKLLLTLTFVYLLFSQPYQSFLPAFARRNLGFDAAGLGLLTSAAGAGALVSSLLMSTIGDPPQKGRLMLATGFAGAFSTILFLSVRVLPAPFVLIAIASAFGNMVDLFSRTIMQSNCDPAYRGRVYSVIMIMTGLTGLITLPAGALADRFSVPLVVGALAVMVIVACAGAAVLRPDIRKLR